mgnify:CR=1 FL=1
MNKKDNTSKKKYTLVFFESFKEAKLAKEKIVESCSGCDQLNLVIREEGNMDDPELLSLNPKIKVFAGDAWALIHLRRKDEHWYDELHES